MIAFLTMATQLISQRPQGEKKKKKKKNPDDNKDTQ